MLQQVSDLPRTMSVVRGNVVSINDIMKEKREMREWVKSLYSGCEVRNVECKV